MIIGDNESLPSGWKWFKAKEILDVRDGTHDSPKYQAIGIPLVTSKNLTNGSIDFSTCTRISEDDHIAISKRSAVDGGDILYAMIGTIGNPVIVKKEFEFSIKNVALFKFNGSNVDNKYFYYFLKTELANRQFDQNTRGGTQQFVSLGNLRDLLVPIPSQKEQKRLAAILAKADSIRRKRQQAIQLADKFLRSVFLDMFGDPIINPKEWKTAAIGDITSDWHGGASFKPDDFTDVGFPVLHKGAIQKSGRILIDSGKKTRTTEEYAEAHPTSVIGREYTTVTLRDLVPTGPSIGLIADLSNAPEPRYILAQGAYAFMIDDSSAKPSYLVYLSNNASFRKWIKKFAVGSTQIHIRTPVFKEIEIPLPNVKLQEKFEAIVKSCTRLTNHHKSLLDNSSHLFASLSQRAYKGDL